MTELLPFVIAKPRQGLKQSLRNEHGRHLPCGVLFCIERDEQRGVRLRSGLGVQCQETAAWLCSSQRQDICNNDGMWKSVIEWRHICNCEDDESRLLFALL